MSSNKQQNEVVLPPAPDTVVLEQVGQFVYITPPVKRLGAWIYTVLHHRAHDAVRGACLAPLADPLVYKVSRYGRPALACGAGLKAFIKDLLEWHGLRVEMRGEPAALTEPARERLSVFRRVDHALLSFVRQYDWGVIWHERQGKVSIARLIAQVALAWPKKGVIVIVTRVEDARRLARRLRKFLPRVGLVTGRDRKDRWERRVVVVTPQFMGRGDLAEERRGICIAVNPTELFGLALGKGGDVLNCLWKARLYGLAATDQKFPPRLRDLLTAYFGPQEVLIPRHGHKPVAVKVVFLPIRGGRRPPSHKNHALIKRLGVHEHHLRNRRICNLAAALASNGIAWLKADYPEVAASLGGKAGRVGVLVDHVQHGLVLAHTLKSVLLVGPQFNAEGLAEDDLARIEIWRPGSPRTMCSPAIITGSGMKHAGHFDMLIRADGGVDLPDIPLAKLSAPDDESPQMLVIDFWDENHPLLRLWSRMRRSAYEEAGWFVVGDEMTDMERFLATRPGVV
jgi:hypothetical protein